MTDPRPSRSLAWNLGAFVGEITRAIRTPVDGPRKGRENRRRFETARRTETRRDGDVVLRRITIDEIEIPAEGDRPPGS